jgi:signal transduction histidine kinase
MRLAFQTTRCIFSLLAGGLCLACPEAQAEVRIFQVVVDGRVRELQASSAHASNATKPLRLSSSARTIQFDFTESDASGKPTARLRYKLEGHDDSWRDLPVLMRVMVRFRGGDHRPLGGGAEFDLGGESPGWRGAAETSEFHPQRKQVVVPEQAANVQVTFVTHGGETGIGQIGIDAVKVTVEPAAGGPAKVFDLGITKGLNLDEPMGTPDLWTRDESSMLEQAKLGMLASPIPHPILILDDDSTKHYGNWSLRPENAIPVRPGDRLTIEWRHAHSIGRSGPDSATYQQLPPGSYTFRVAAAKANGSLTGEEVSLPVTVVAPIVRRWEFWLAMASLAGGGLIWGRQVLSNRRMKLQLAEIEHQQELERERARIARDLHDDIGAGLTEIAMQSDWVRRDLAQGPTEDTQRRIERVCQSAVELTRSVDEIVWALNPANDTLDRFANFLMQSTKQFVDAAGLRVRFDIPPELPSTPLPGKIRHSLSQAVREALNNAVKHARADLIRVELTTDDAGLHLVIEDNGSGFGPDQTGAAGTREGLDGMRRRMAEIGGKFHLSSSPGGGTRVELNVPLEQEQ